MGMQREIVLAGATVALSVMTEADQPSFHTWMQDPVLRAQVDDLRIPTLEDQAAWFRRSKEADRRFFSIVTLPDKKLIGHGGFVDIDTKKHEAVLRITIGDTEAHGKGYGTEAVSLLLAYAFDTALWKRVLLHVLEGNERAIRTYQKSGFKRTSQRERSGQVILTMSIDAPSRPS